MYTRSFGSVLVALFVLAFAAGCEKSSEASEGASETSAEHAHGTEHDQAGHHENHGRAEGSAGEADETGGAKDGTIEVPADGKKFEPAVSAEAMPSGAWHCNMNGKVHYAGMEKGDGRCPVCNMKLKEAN